MFPKPWRRGGIYRVPVSEDSKEVPKEWYEDKNGLGEYSNRGQGSGAL